MTLREPLQRVLGQAFTIERELTGGGMAHLYVALDTALNRRVVVKVLPRERAEGVSAERFRGEIRTIAALQHPNIVGILSAGEVDGLPYYMMPYIDGESLRALLVRDESMSPRETVAILRDVARACAYAHARGIVHRDIKPDNVLLSGGAAMITDFGVAKALSVAQRPAGNTTMTRDGFTVGTPMYMAPEQLAGDPQIDHRVDFYAMGVMAYEMLAGQVPFAHPTPRALLAAQLSEPAKPLGQVRPDVPARLAKLVAACLQKDPDDRPATADVILAALDDPALMSDEFLAGRSGASRFPPTEPVAVLRSRRRVRGGIVAAVTAAVVAAAVVVWRQPGGSPAASPASGATTAAASVALLSFTDESPDSSAGYLAAGVTEGIAGRLTGLPGLRVAAGMGADRPRSPQATPADLGRELGVAALLSGKVRRTGGRVEVTATLTDVGSGEELFSRTIEGPVLEMQQLEETLAADAAAALAKQFSSFPKPTLRTSRAFRDGAAYDRYLQGRYALRNPASGGLQSAFQSFQEAQLLDSSAVPVYLGLAEVHAAMPDYSSMTADVALPRALAYAERAVALDSASPRARVTRGEMLLDLWRWNEATAELRRGVELDSADPVTRAAYGRALLLGGDAMGAARELGAAAALDSGSAEIAGLAGISLVLSGQIGKGVQAAQRAVDLLPGSPAPRVLLGAAYLYAARPFDAVFTLAGAMELDPNNAEVLGMLGYAYAMMGQPAKARAMLTRLARSPQRAGTQPAMARIHIGLGQPDDALGLLEKAVRSHDGLFARESLFTPIFEPLRQHPRFERLLDRLGLRRPD